MARPAARGPSVRRVLRRRPAADHHVVSRRPAPLDPVALVDRWDGFCLPCGSGARPLALTWTGQRGLRAWLAGAGWGDGVLRLTCACCGGVDVVGWEDEPEPETDEQPVRVEQPVTEVPAAAPAPVVRVVRVLDLDAPSADAVHAVAQVPAPRRPSRAERRAAARRTPAPRGAADADALDLLHLAG